MNVRRAARVRIHTPIICLLECGLNLCRFSFGPHVFALRPGVGASCLLPVSSPPESGGPGREDKENGTFRVQSSSPHAAASPQGGLGQVAPPLCASASVPVKWGHSVCHVELLPEPMRRVAEKVLRDGTGSACKVLPEPQSFLSYQTLPRRSSPAPDTHTVLERLF